MILVLGYVCSNKATACCSHSVSVAHVSSPSTARGDSLSQNLPAGTIGLELIARLRFAPVAGSLAPSRSSSSSLSIDSIPSQSSDELAASASSDVWSIPCPERPCGMRVIREAVPAEAVCRKTAAPTADRGCLAMPACLPRLERGRRLLIGRSSHENSEP